MKIAILTKDNNLYSCKRLYESAKKRGHILDMIDPNLNCMIINNNYNPISYLSFNGKKISKFDAVISRINPKNTYGMSILRYFEMNGSYVLNKSDAIIKAKNKFFSMQLLSNKGIDVPNTVFLNSLSNIDHIIDLLGIPLIIKFINGTQGIGVIIANTKESIISIIEAFHNVNINIIIQEYIAESNGYDIRCLVIDGKVVGSIKRKAKKGDFRANLHRGGIARNVNISEKEKKIAIKSASLLGLSIAGVDIIRSSRGPLVIEVNASPGIEGIENVLKINIADLVIKLIEKNVLNKNF